MLSPTSLKPSSAFGLKDGIVRDYSFRRAESQNSFEQASNRSFHDCGALDGQKFESRAM